MASWHVEPLSLVSQDTTRIRLPLKVVERNHRFPVIARFPLAGGRTTAVRLRCTARKPGGSRQTMEEDSELDFPSRVDLVPAQFQKTSQYERLFSNLNEATLRREPGSMTGSVLLVAGTTIGAGILAIPAVTQEAGFLASAVTCLLCWLYMVVTGILVAEVNVNTMCELGSGGVSLVSMAMRTLGKGGVQVACWSYLFIHYALLVAYVARCSEAITSFLGIPLWESAIIFSSIFGGICYWGSQRTIGAINGFLVFGILISFAALVGVAATDIEWSSLLQANFKAVPKSIPIICLSFVYQNVVPVLCTNLEGNLPKVSCFWKWIYCERHDVPKHCGSSETPSRGTSTVVIWNNNIFARRPMNQQHNTIIAQGRTYPNQNTGISIQNCKSSLDDLIDPADWLEWDGNFALQTLYYGEYMNTGVSAVASKRFS